MPRTDVPDLPEEIQRQIVQLLSAKACCNAANACKAFYQWANAVCTINATTVFPNRRNLSSLVLFQERRCQMGLKVEVLHLNFYTYGELEAFMVMTGDLLRNIQLCSATLTELHLDGLHLEPCFDQLEDHRGATGWDLKDTICQCKQLRSLRISFQVAGRCSLPPDGGEVVAQLSAALPQLATLLWLVAVDWPEDPHFLSDFIASKAVERPRGLGLRVLQAQHCSFNRVAHLPASLQLLSLSNPGDCQPPRMSAATQLQPLISRLHILLRHCAALHELYVLRVRACTPGVAQLDLTKVAAHCPALRVLVLHIEFEDDGAGAGFGRGEGVLPDLEVLVVIQAHMVFDELTLRAPALKVLVMDMSFAPSLAKGLIKSARSTLQHLQLVLAESEVLEAPGDISEGFWRAMEACTELAAIQLVILTHGQAPDQLVCRFLEAALLGPPLCLPKLASVALYLDSAPDMDSGPPVFSVGVPLAPEQGAQGVCNALGRLVAAGVLPALRQVLLEPCAHDFDSEWGGGPGPQCDGAPAVEVWCRHMMREVDSRVPSSLHLRRPEESSAFSKAALRAFDSLDIGPM